jgi:amino acid adenylation domain-containing protein/non-ribosomal peptide synthase protein (TIGR01720 family)
MVSALETSRALSARGIRFVGAERSERFVSYEELREAALGRLAALGAAGVAGGDELLLHVDDPYDFLTTLWGCFYGRIVPVPVSASGNDELRRKILRIWQLLERPRLLSSGPSFAKLVEFAEANGFASLLPSIEARSTRLEELPAGGGELPSALPDPSDVAFVQFSSGSTGEPKGVVLTHENLATNIGAMIAGAELEDADSTLSWMPLTHDMGLIGFHLTPLVAGLDQSLLPTPLFLRHPTLWMQKGSEHGSTVTSSPNFGYKHFLSSFRPGSDRNWDLSRIRLIFNGAEPISPTLAQEFLGRMAPFGLRESAMFPVYGLAEASLAVTFPPPGEGLRTIDVDRGSLAVGREVIVLDGGRGQEGMTFVDLGNPVRGTEVEIAGDDGGALGEGRLGRIRIRGRNVTAGYYRNPEATAAAISAEGWLDTGDLGFLRGRRLVVTGRAKEIIFANGQNWYPHDLERIAERTGIETGAVAICGATDPVARREVVLAFVRWKGGLDRFAPVALALRDEIRRAVGLDLSAIVPVRALPKTTSGKIQRYKLAEAYLSAEYDDALRELAPLLETEARRRAVEPPATETESRLHLVWREVLGREEIGVTDPFLAAGGDSLQATLLSGRLASEFDIEIPIEEILASGTIRQLARRIDEAPRQPVGQAPDRSTPCDAHPLSSAQRRLLVLEELHRGSVAYNLPAAFVVRGPFDAGRLANAFRALVARHPALRSSIAIRDGEPIAVVAPNLDARVELSEGGDVAVDDLVRRFVRPFDLAKGPLVRLELVRLPSDEQILLFDAAHIVVDGMSLAILLRELGVLYQGGELGPAPPPYADFVAWQGSLVDSEEFRRREARGVERLRGEIPALDLPTDSPRPPVPSLHGGRVRFHLESEERERLRALATERGTTLFATLLAIHATILFRLTGQGDVVVGSPVSGRRNPRFRLTVGMFVNTLPIRSSPRDELRFADFLDEVARGVVAALDEQDVPLDRIVDRLAIPRDLSRNPLFDTMFALQNIGLPPLRLGEAILEPLPIDPGSSRFDLAIDAVESERGIDFVLEYASDLFRRETAQRFADYFRNLAREIARNPELKLGEVDLVPDAERRALLADREETRRDLPAGETIPSLFATQVGRIPDSPAIVTADGTISYRDLDRRVEALARALLARGVGRGAHVGVAVDPGIDLVASLLAILRVGAAYVPLDPELPAERIAFTLADGEVRFVLTEGRHAGRLGGSAQPILVDAPDEPPGAMPSNVAPSPDDPAYVISTSGSTGRPKGVVVEHRAVVNFIHGMVERLSLREGEVVLAVTTVSFDIAGLEILLPLATGGTVALANAEERKDPRLLARAIRNRGVKLLQLTPSRLRALLATPEGPGALAGVATLLVGGEAFPESVLPEIRSACRCRVFNVYGPTETTIWSTVEEVRGTGPVTLGRPIANTRCYVLDSRRRLQPTGVVGELAIAGAGLARGYWNREELTAERFVPDPLVPGERMYRTGDLARRLPDGRLVFHGRSDQQVKIRGYRIELGEVEGALRDLPGIHGAIVTTLPDSSGCQALCAHFVSDEGLAPDELRRALARSLPESMIPTFLVRLEALPLLPNGKVDRKALPPPELTHREVAGSDEPADDLERRLARQYAAVLGLDRVGRDDDFFAIGGHSLKATLLAARIGPDLGIDLPLRTLFEARTVRTLAERLRPLLSSEGKGPAAAIPRAPDREDYDLSPAQRRLFVTSQLDPESTGYNMPAFLAIRGSFDRSDVERALARLVDRHESLRTSLHLSGERPVQRIADRVEVRVDSLVAPRSSLGEVARAFVRPFDLAVAPLLRAAVVTTPDGERFLLFDMHHSISDGASLAILVREFSILLEGGTLPPLPLRYRDFSELQNGRLASGSLAAEEAYWLGVFEDTPSPLQLPLDFPRAPVQSSEGSRFPFRIPADTVLRLERIGQARGATLFMTLLAAFQLFLGKLAGQDDVVVGTPISGRSTPDLAGIVGMFANTLPIRSAPEGTKRFDEFLAEVASSSVAAFENASYPFDLLVDRLDLARDTSRNPLFDAMFVFGEEELFARSTGAALVPEPFDRGSSPFDLTLEVTRSSGGLLGELEYSTRLFRPATAARFARLFSNLLASIAREPEGRLADLQLTDDDERSRLLEAGRGPAATVPPRSVLELIAARADRSPDRIAIGGNGRSYRYRDLLRLAGHLAAALRERGAGPRSIVAVLVERSPELPIALLGILASGAAYLPIDPELPDERIEFLLADSGASHLVVSSSFANRAGSAIPRLVVEELLAEEREGGGFESIPEPGDLAYVIYTSGSTGTPKGVLVEHRNLSAYLAAFEHELRLGEGDVVVAQASVAFDASIEEIFPILAAGGRLVVAERDEILDPERFASLLRRNGATLLSASPLLLEQLDPLPPIPSIRRWVSGGDELRADRVPHLLERGILYNTYGPTEGTVCATYYRCDGTERGAVPIGRAILGTTVRVLDRFGRLQPIGVPGELALAGAGVARGYRNRPELTAERFVPDPFEPGGRLYRTGDLVRWREDLTLEFLGRIDRQVKVRGYRIELGEIEAQLRGHPGVRDAAVIATDGGDGTKTIVGYAVPDEGTTAADLRRYLSERIPSYMVPAHLVPVAAIPRTRRGKVDLRALPKPAPVADERPAGNAPTTPIEERLAGIFGDVLGMPGIGIDDDFFSLGGDSIKAIQISSRLKRFDLQLDVAAIFRNPTIRALAPLVTPLKRRADQGVVTGAVPLSPIQREFFERRFASSHHWNQAVMLRSERGFDEGILRKVLDALTEQHDALRMVFRSEGEVVTQVNRGLDGRRFLLERFDVRGGSDPRAEVERLATAVQGSLDLENGPLVAAALFRAESGDHLLLAIHHLVVDGVSWRILLEDFASAWRQASAGGRIAFDPKSDSFQSFAERLAENAASAETLGELPYWREIDLAEVPPFPRDRSAPAGRQRDGRIVTLSLDRDETAKLQTEAHRAYRTETADLLLAALGLALRDGTGHDRFLIDLEGHGREPIGDDGDLGRTVGWFTSLFPVLLDTREARDPGFWVRSVKESLRRIPRRGIGYGLLRHLTPKELLGGAGLRARPEISFNHFGEFDEALAPDVFSLSPFPTGELLAPDSEREHLLEWNAMILRGELRVTIGYDGSAFAPERIEALGARFLDRTRELVLHCTSREESVASPSDYGDSALSLDELDGILGEIGDV